jgi:hypothetical protein
MNRFCRLYWSRERDGNVVVYEIGGRHWHVQWARYVGPRGR